MQEFDHTKDYTKTGDTYDRENYKAYVANLPQDEIVTLLLSVMVGSTFKMTNWEKAQLAENLAEIKYGKEEEQVENYYLIIIIQELI